jgi:RNA polymerase sigma-70 factor, ECF subfamily
MDQPAEASLSVAEAIAAARAGFAACKYLVGVYLPLLEKMARDDLPEELNATLGASGIVQEVLLRFWRTFPEFRGRTEGELKAWFRTTFQHTLEEELRRAAADKRQPPGPRVPFPTPGSGISSPDCPDPEPTPATRAAEQEAVERIRRAAMQLPVDQRLAFLLNKEYGLTDRQIAPLLDRSEGAVTQLRARALARLRQELRSTYEP